MVGVETLKITQRECLVTFHKYTLRESLYIHFAQLRHHQENAGLYASSQTNWTKKEDVPIAQKFLLVDSN